MEHTPVLAPPRPPRAPEVIGDPHPSRPAAIWQLWPGPGAPATTAEEHTFVARLATLAPATGGRPAPRERRVVTAVLNALRCGITVDDLLDRAPGLRPCDLLDAYRDLDRRRRIAVRAWHAMERRRTIDSLTEHGPVAAQLLPVLVARLVTAAEIGGERGVAYAIAAASVDLAATAETELRLETAMARRSGAERAAVGRQLYDLYEPGLWSTASYLPTRVGSLVPVRVAALLGER